MTMVENQNKYNVICTGCALDGFILDDVITAFATAFKITPEKAKDFLSVRRTLKKSLSQAQSETYLDRLTAIGVEAVLELIEAVAIPTSGLSLMPVEGEDDAEVGDIGEAKRNPADSLTMAKPGASANGTAGQITCPKCNVKQAKAAQCSNCGVFMDKVMKTSQLESPVRPEGRLRRKAAVDVSDIVVESSDVNVQALAYAGGAALIGAFLWKLIVVVFGYELGLVAWGIGGLIGFTAASFHSRGDVTGIVCAALAVASILGGKYMVTATFQDEFISSFSEYSEGREALMSTYEEYTQSALVYSDLDKSDEEVKQFIVDYGYSYASDASEVTELEFSEFTNDYAPKLEDFTLRMPDFETWTVELLDGVTGEVPTFDIMIEGLDLMDFLLMFFGVATAYRLGRGGE